MQVSLRYVHSFVYARDRLRAVDWLNITRPTNLTLPPFQIMDPSRTILLLFPVLPLVSRYTARFGPTAAELYVLKDNASHHDSVLCDMTTTIELWGP